MYKVKVTELRGRRSNTKKNALAPMMFEFLRILLIARG